MGREKIYCFCWNPSEGFMVNCDGCDGWYHGPCVGESERSIANTKKWFCRYCKATNNKFDELTLTLKKMQAEATTSQEVSDDERQVAKKCEGFKETILELKAAHETVKINLENELAAVKTRASEDIANANEQVDNLRKALVDAKSENCKLLTNCQNLEKKLEELRKEMDSTYSEQVICK